MNSYPVLFTPEGKGFVVTVPDIPEVVTEGDSIAEATEYAIDAIELVLGEYMRRRAEIPRPTKRRGRHIRIVEFPLLTQAKLSLYLQCKHRESEKPISRGGSACQDRKSSACSISLTAHASNKSSRPSAP